MNLRVAIFDFDGTLYSKETYQLMMEHLKNHPVYHTKYKRFFYSLLPTYIAYKLKLYPEQKMRARSMQVYLNTFKDLPQKDLENFFHEMAEKMQKDFNPQVLSRLEQHLAAKDHVMLVSGAFTPLLHAATKHLTIDTIIGTAIPFKKQKLDGEVPLYHVQGNKKTEQIQANLKEKEINWENSFAYGDSYSDLPVLELVGNPVAVRPKPQLRSIAEERNWQII